MGNGVPLASLGPLLPAALGRSPHWVFHRPLCSFPPAPITPVCPLCASRRVPQSALSPGGSRAANGVLIQENRDKHVDKRAWQSTSGLAHTSRSFPS